MANKKINKVESLLTNNKIGTTEMQINRKEAQKEIKDAFTIDEKKLKEGYVWLTNGKTSKLVHPNNVHQNIADGFKLTKKIEL